MPPKLYKAILSAVIVVLLVGVSFIQRELANERDALGLTRYTELKGAPPVLALTTVALGGFRGLISNALWIRANDLQDQDKFFEMVQLADWITKLEPHFSQVWLVQAWNMAYNISVKFKDPQDRWRWVERGIQLLRDEGLNYNPNDILMYRELAWFFQHKMGQNMDDAHMYYKRMWNFEMNSIFGTGAPDWDKLINPKTDDEKKRAALLRDKYKMDPVFMKQTDELYGPLEWHLPEASAIYWAAKGLEEVQKHPRDQGTADLIMLRRVIYQSMHLAFQRGRLVVNKTDGTIEFGPNLQILPKASEAYEQAMVDDPTNRDHIETAHRNLLRDAIFFLYSYNRMADAQKWFKYLGEKYPNKPALDGKPNSFPKNLDLDSYAIGRIQDEGFTGGKDKVQAVVEGMLRTAFMSLAIGDDDRYTGLVNLAQKIWSRYQLKTARDNATENRVGLPPLPELRNLVLERMFNEEISPELGAQLRTKLGLSATAFAPAGTNSVSVSATDSTSATNADWTTTLSGLQYQVLKHGTGTVSPKPTDTVRVHYQGTLTNGTVFDSSVNRGQPATFGVNQVIAGWTEGLQLMKVGDKFRFKIPPGLAYGEKGFGEKIPPNSTLIFDLELLGIE